MTGERLPTRTDHDDQTVLDVSPETLVARFAQAVAARTDEVFIVRADNSGYWTPWLDDGLPAGPYAVHIADGRGFRTLALDLDSDGAARDADGITALLRQAGVAHALIRSGPRGGRHILATFAEPIPPAAMARMARALRHTFPSLDDAKLRNPETGAIRPPLAPHRFGGRSEVVGDSAEALRILEAGNPREAWRRLADAIGIPLLSPRMERLLREGDAACRYSSRSEVVQAIALAHVNAGSDEEQLLEDLIDPMNIAGEKVRQMHHRRCVHYVHRSWLRGCTRARRSPIIQTRPDALNSLSRIRAAVEAAPWPGRVGAITHLIIQTHLALAEIAGGPDYFASVRDIADLASVHVMTVVRHHKRLLRAGWLRRRGLRYPGHATRWRLLDPHVAFAYRVIPLRGVCDVCMQSRTTPGVADSTWDLWRHRGLGKIAMWIWELMGVADAAIDELSARLGVTRRTIRRHLVRMRRLGLVLPAGERWVRADDAFALELAALTLGVVGESERQRERHRAERLAFHAKREGLMK